MSKKSSRIDKTLKILKLFTFTVQKVNFGQKNELLKGFESTKSHTTVKTSHF
jgi:hypothetical protein